MAEQAIILIPDINGFTVFTSSTEIDHAAHINREMTSERIGMRHNCVFHGLKITNTAVYRDFREDHARHAENVGTPEIKPILEAHYEREALGDRSIPTQIQRELDGHATAGGEQERA